jgi:hypothetical protein
VAKLGRSVAKLGRWVAKLVAHLLATAALWARIQKSPKNTNGRHKKRSDHFNKYVTQNPVLCALRTFKFKQTNFQCSAF